MKIIEIISSLFPCFGNTRKPKGQRKYAQALKVFTDAKDSMEEARVLLKNERTDLLVARTTIDDKLIQNGVADEEAHRFILAMEKTFNV